MNRKQLSVNDKQKIKMKKNAMDYVNYEEEKRKDPKFKTELCKSWIETGFCVYGNKCRFAHGRHELFVKAPAVNYKLKSCKSFNEQGICLYGARCNFKHDKRKLKDIELPYYYIRLFIKNDMRIGNSNGKGSGNAKRLKVFEDITDLALNENCSVSTLSNDEYENDNSNCNSNDDNSLNGNDYKPYYPKMKYRKEVDDMEYPLNSMLSFMM